MTVRSHGDPDVRVNGVLAPRPTAPFDLDKEKFAL